ncbi:MAG TPA: electron transport complex subunit RsxD [Thiothrix sp.]|nr:electron transport complex subunit RsxD [Thiothrix sp.]
MEFKTDTLSPANTLNPQAVSSLMRDVAYALLPGTLVMFYFFGWGVLLNISLAITFAIILESFMLYLRQRPIRPFLGDYSALVTAWLLGLSLPPLAAWWLILVAIFFAIVIAKHLYGGLGYNPFNPAMVGYAVVLISFPIEMTQWLSAQYFHAELFSFTESLNTVFFGLSHTQWDALTSATPLDHLKTNLHLNITISESMNSEQYGWLAGKGWEWISLAFLMGGVWLIYRKVITWHIPFAFLLGLTLIASFFWLWDSESYASPLFHVLSGAAILGAFFIATDPVSASTTPTGKLIYAAGIGLSTYIIRTWGGFPDGVAFSVIIMNMAVPLIDYYTKPRVFSMS